MDLSPDGRFGFIPERDQDTVARFDTHTLKIVKRAQFPRDTRPWMLRVSPDGREVWVQTASGTNAVLDAGTLKTLDTQKLGKSPVTTAWSPDGRYNFVTQADDTWVAITDASTYKLVKRLEVGHGGANVSFRADGKYGYVAVTGANSVAVVDMEALEVSSRLRTGKQPMGLIVL